MTTIKISRTLNSPDNEASSVVFRELPTTWNDLSCEKREASLTILLNFEEDKANFELIKLFLDLPKKQFNQLPNSLISELTPLVEWCKSEPDYTCVFDEMLFEKKVYQFPKAGFENATLFQFAYCDYYFYKFQLEPNKSNLIGLMATMFCPKQDELDAFISNFSNSKKLNEVYLVAALNFFIGVKSYLAEVYSEIFNAVDPGENTEVVDIPNPIFGWHSTAEDIAESGIFGNKDAVMLRNVHEIFLYLRRKKQEADALMKEMKRNSDNI